MRKTQKQQIDFLRVNFVDLFHRQDFTKKMRFSLLFVLVTAPALFFLLNVANANIEEEGIGGEKEGVVSLETRLEFAEEAEREIESDVVFPAEASDDDFDIKDDDEDVSLLYAQITEDLKPVSYTHLTLPTKRIV